MELLSPKKNKKARFSALQSTSPPALPFFIFMMVVSFFREGAAQTLNIEADDYKINAITSYKLTFNISLGTLKQNIPSGSLFAITFPKDYDTEMLHNITLPGYDSTKIYECPEPDPLCTSVNITYSGSTFIFDGFFLDNISGEK